MDPALRNFIIVVSAVWLLIGWLRSPMGRGAMGELRVKLVLGKTKPGERYIIHNLTIVQEGKSSQIDHILVNKNGVFVIETKNYSGRIYGDEHQQQWTQVLNYGRVKHKLYNPVKQNATHIYRINKVLEGKFAITSLVVFTQNNTRYITAPGVIPLSALKKTVKRKGGIELSPEDMHTIYETLCAARSKLSRRAHVKGIRQMQRELNEGICPRCSGKLVQRQGKRGTFTGCENYPTCTFTKKA